MAHNSEPHTCIFAYKHSHLKTYIQTNIQYIHTVRYTPYPGCLHNKLCLCLQHWVDNTLVNIDCLWVVHYRVSAVTMPPLTHKGRNLKQCVCAGVSKKYIYIYLQMEKFILGMNSWGMNDEFHRVIGFCCQGCPLVSDDFIQLATATMRALLF